MGFRVYGYEGVSHDEVCVCELAWATRERCVQSMQGSGFRVQGNVYAG